MLLTRHNRNKNQEKPQEFRRTKIMAAQCAPNREYMLRNSPPPSDTPPTQQGTHVT